MDSYSEALSEAYTARMAAKMGVLQYDKPLTVGLITLMYEDKADFTNTFRALASASVEDAPGTVPAPLAEVWHVLLTCVRAWMSRYLCVNLALLRRSCLCCPQSATACDAGGIGTDFVPYRVTPGTGGAERGAGSCVGPVAGQLPGSSQGGGAQR